MRFWRPIPWGSCIGIAIHDKVAKVGGLLHFMLPESSLAPTKAQTHPYMFADAGIPLLFREAYKLGAQKQHLRVVVVGGSQTLDPKGFFNIGQKNIIKPASKYLNICHSGLRRNDGSCI